MLDTELKFFNDNRAELAKNYAGRFLVIKGSEITGIYETREEALSGAAEKHGLTDVLIRRPEDVEELVSIPSLAFGMIHANL
jgi:hypothetical protein